MNTAQAKQIQIVDFFYKIGNRTKKDKGYERWYSSPFRKDEDASLKVDIKQNIWYDFGIGKGGNIIDLVMLINNCNVSTALQLLSDTSLKLAPKSVLNNYKLADEKENKTVINNIRELKHIALVDYVNSRGIELQLAKRYLFEVHYTSKNKNLFSIGFKNRSGGWELRNKYAKGCINKKDFSLLTLPINGVNFINVFEGFFDFLSHRQMYKDNANSLILNSLSMLNSSINELKKYNQINLFLDNDPAGKTASQFIENSFVNVANYSNIYNDFNDFNDYLVSNIH